MLLFKYKSQFINYPMVTEFLTDFFSEILPYIDQREFSQSSSNKYPENVDLEDLASFIELLAFHWGFVSKDFIDHTVFADEFCQNGWREKQIDFYDRGHMMGLRFPIRTNVQVSNKITEISLDWVKADILIDLYVIGPVTNTIKEQIVFITDQFADFLSERMIGLEYLIRLDSRKRLGFEFVIPVAFTTKTELFKFLEKRPDRVELMNKYIDFVPKLLLFLFTQEADDSERVNELFNLRHPKALHMAQNDKKSLVFSMYRNTGRVTIPLPSRLFLENTSVLEHYRKLMDIREVFERIDEIFQDEIPEIAKEENAVIIETLVELNIREFIQNY